MDLTWLLNLLVSFLLYDTHLCKIIVSGLELKGGVGAFLSLGCWPLARRHRLNQNKPGALQVKPSPGLFELRLLIQDSLMDFNDVQVSIS